MARERDDDYEDDADADERPARRGKSGGGDAATVPNYLIQSIAVTFCCCLPLGVVGIINAAKVNGLVAEGKMSEAREASAQAKKWSTYGAIAGLVVNGLAVIGYLIIVVLAVGAGANAK